jgi:hypothetical protein
MKAYLIVNVWNGDEVLGIETEWGVARHVANCKTATSCGVFCEIRERLLMDPKEILELFSRVIVKELVEKVVAELLEQLK